VAHGINEIDSGDKDMTYSTFGSTQIAPIVKTAVSQLGIDIGIEGKYGKRWHATNVDVVAEDAGQRAALVQRRDSTGKPGRYTSVKKYYYVVAERDGKVLAYEVRAMSTTPLAVAMERVGLGQVN
jgi:hypothetical protein